MIRNSANLRSVSELLFLIRNLENQEKSQKIEICKEEILRTAVVFLYAILDDQVRELARVRLNLISTKTTQDHIQLSESLNGPSFSSSRDIKSLLERVKVDCSDLSQYFGQLDHLIMRRHQIVHQADLERNDGKWNTVPIETSDVAKWWNSVSMFCSTLNELVIPPNFKQIWDDAVAITMEYLWHKKQDNERKNS